MGRIKVFAMVLGCVFLASAYGAGKTLFVRKPFALKPEIRNWIPALKTSSRTDRVYGVSFQYRARKEAVLAPRDCRLYKGKSITTYQTFYPDYGLLSF